MFNLSSLSSLQLFQLIRYGTFIIIGIGFAKLRLSQSAIGQFETFVMVSGMVSFFWVSGIINTMLSVYPKKNETEKKSILFNTFLSLCFFSLVAGVLLLLFSQNLLAFLDKANEGNIIRLSIIYLLLNNPSFLTEYIFFLNDRKKEIVVYGVISALVSIAAALVPVIMNYPIEYSIYGLIGVAFLRILFTISLLSNWATFSFDFRLLKEHLAISTPVILSLFVSGSSEYIDGIIVKAKFDDVFFAVYRYGAKELPILLIIANTFSTAMIPAVAANLEDGMQQIKEKSARMMHFLFPLTIVLMILSPYLYRYIFNESFVYSAYIFNIYLLLVIPRMLFPQTILTGMQQTRLLLISSVLEITINISLSIYLADIMGLPGVALGTLIAYTFDKIFLMAAGYFVFGIRPSQYVRFIPYLVYVVLTLVSFAVGYIMLTKI